MRGRTSYERQLASLLYKRGWAVMRAPASGAKVKRYPYPDLVALKKGYAAAIEVKTVSEERAIYVPKRQVETLMEWKARGGAEPWIAVKVLDGRGWRFFRTDELEETEKSFKLVPKGGLTLEEFNRIPELSRIVPLTNFVLRDEERRLSVLDG